MGRLTGKQKKYLRGLGHQLNPVVMVGQRGITPALRGKFEEELYNHELIKIKVATDSVDGVKKVAADLADEAKGEVLQVIGRIALVYKRRPEDPEIELP
jgi:RNA-binding protein